MGCVLVLSQTGLSVPTERERDEEDDLPQPARSTLGYAWVQSDSRGSAGQYSSQLG